jgi:hypothetical protein
VSVITVVLDAANIAFTNAGRDGASYRFCRVEQVRDAWMAQHPRGVVRAVTDASALRRMPDEHLARRAKVDGWLDIAPGDADDVILDLAERYGAMVVSNDNFAYARDDHPWLQGCADRVFSASWRGGTLLLQPRLLKVATAEDIARARREKATKAGIRHDLGDRVWRCTARMGECSHAGEVVPHSRLRHRGRQAFCVCGSRAEERHADLPHLLVTGPPQLTVLHHDRVHHVVPIDAGRVVLGRGGRSRPHVHDITAGLKGAAATEISREHLEVLLDDDRNLIVRHLALKNATFLNPRLGADGLPMDNRLEDGAEYLIGEGDTLWLGPGVITLIVTVPRLPAT